MLEAVDCNGGRCFIFPLSLNRQGAKNAKRDFLLVCSDPERGIQDQSRTRPWRAGIRLKIVRISICTVQGVKSLFLKTKLNREGAKDVPPQAGLRIPIPIVIATMTHKHATV